MEKFLTVVAALTGLLAALTASWPAWIEAALSVDPDMGSGALEWSLVAALTASCMLCLTLARRLTCSMTQ